MDEYLAILLENPFQSTLKEASDELFIVYAFEWELAHISRNGIYPSSKEQGPLGIYCTKLDDDLEKRDRLLKMKLQSLDAREYKLLNSKSQIDKDNLKLIRPILVRYSGQYTNFSGYLNGTCVEGICSIPAAIPAYALEISPMMVLEPLSVGEIEMEHI
jgi:hypothetical protein